MTDQPVRLIAADMDGTLLGRNNQIPRQNIDAIREARAAGITVAVCTGRFPENAYLKLEDSGIRCPIIGTNGAQIVDEGLRPLISHSMEGETARQVLEILLSMGADAFIYGPKAVATLRPDARHHTEVSHGDRARALGLAYLHGPEEARKLTEGPVHKFYVCNNVPLEPVRKALEQVEHVWVTSSAPENIEVMPEGIDKGRGLREFAALQHISMSQVMALGDYDNDIPMLRSAGYGVAMGNACRAAKDAARFVTGNCWDGGFAQAVRAWALKDGGEGYRADAAQPGHAGPDPLP